MKLYKMIKQSIDMVYDIYLVFNMPYQKDKQINIISVEIKAVE